MTRWLLIGTAVAALLAFAACSGGSSSTRTAVAPIPRVANTGIPALDQSLDAALAPDDIEMARLTGYERIPCAKQQDAAHPQCRDNEDEGTTVEILPLLGCEPGWVRPEDLPDAYHDALVDKDPELVGVYAPAAGIDPYNADYVAVISTGKHDNGANAAIGLHFRQGRIVAMEDDCGDSLRLLSDDRIARWLLRPGATAPEPTPTSPTAAPAETPAT
jgi:hypothetical protein